MSDNLIPPQNLKAEEAILGALMISEKAIETVAERLKASDFYRDSHSRIYLAALSLYEKGEPVDVITLADELGERGELERVGGKKRIQEIGALVPISANAGHYAQIVKETAVLRTLIEAGSNIARLGWERPGDISELLDQAEHYVFGIREKEPGELEHIGGALKETFATISEIHKSNTGVVGTPSGFRSLDSRTAGFQPGNLVILAARPSMGKSALGCGMAANLSVRLNIPTAMFTLEMSRMEVTQRLLSVESSIGLYKLRTGKLSLSDWPSLTEACNRLAQSPIYVDDSASISLMMLRSRVRRLKAQQPELGLVIVDYLQLMVPERRSDKREQEVAQISRSLKALARDMSIPVLAMSQLNREAEKRPDKRPLLADLRDSGAVEQDADLVLLLYRDSYYHKDTSQPGVAELHIAKHRNGPTGIIKLAWSEECAKFGELAT